MEEQKDPRRKKLLTVFGAWLIGIIIILIIFAINSKRIFSIIDETRFVENVFGNTGGGQNIAKTDQQSADKASESTPYNQVEIFTLTQTQPDLPADTAAEQQPGEQSTIFGEDQNPPAVPAEQALTDVKLYFVVVDSDGTVSRKDTVRQLETGNSPLTAAIEALLRGPSQEEEKKGLQTLIPEGTKLLSAMVRDGIAILNFSEDFQYNRYGVEGYLGQLMQIVYTATAFTSVDSVQIIIEGQKRNYLGSEGVWIGTPLNAAAF